MISRKNILFGILLVPLLLVTSYLKANPLQDIIPFIRQHEGEIISGSAEGNDNGDISWVFSTRNSRVWQVDQDSGEIIDQGELQLDQGSSKINFALERNKPIEWTHEDLMAFLRSARLNGTIHRVFLT